MENDHCVNKVPLFNHLTPAEQAEIQSLVYHRSYKKGEIIFSPQNPEQLTIIASGKMKVYHLSSQGREQLIRIVGPGDYDGENYLFGLKNKALYGEALTDTMICCLLQTRFADLLKKYPQLGLKLLDLNAQKTVELENPTQLLGLDKIEDRLLFYLADLAEPGHQETIKIPIPLKEVANYLGTNPETLSRNFKSLEKEGLISRKIRKVELGAKFWQRLEDMK